MNLTRALEVALPDIPARKLAESTPRLDPGTTSREHNEDGRCTVRIYVPSVFGMYSLEKSEWELVRLFDGKRSYEEIAELYSQQNAVQYDADTVREFAASLEASEFWYKTPQEKNIQLMQMTLEERKKKLKGKNIWADLSDVDFPAFNPDRFITWAHDKTRFIYTPWFTMVCLLGVFTSVGITIANWPVVWQDTYNFYTFSHRTWIDVIYMYTLGMFVVGVHEFAHAHACKHYGGRVPAMGFALVYLLPAFYTDTTEGFVHGSFYQRLIISFAGVWSEMLMYALATPIWWATPPDTLIHDSAHFIMMMCGIMSLVLNWNPLIKLDGYYMLADFVGIPNLKEESTAYSSAWVKKQIWGLPVDVPFIPKARRFGYVVYSLISGAYSYSVLYILARFAGNFVRNFSPEWGFVPEIGVALIIFRSRIRLLVNFMKFLYLDKKDLIRAWFTPRHTAMAAGLLGVLLVIPVWKESVAGKFVLEPVKQAAVRAHVPGVVSRIFVREGEKVAEGSPLATLSNLAVESGLADAHARLAMASAQSREAALQYRDYGNTLMEKERLSSQVRQSSEMSGALELKAPFAGTILTPRVDELLGAYLKPGGQLLEIADLTELRARIYVSEYDLYKVRLEEPAKIQLDGRMGRINGKVDFVTARPTERLAVDPAEAENQPNGGKPHQFYSVDIRVENPEEKLRSGMTGIGRIYGSRRSIGGLAMEEVKNFWGRKLW